MSEAYDEFAPHWFLQLQGGAAYTIGEAEFKNSISPAAQVAVGYKFNKLLSLRLAVDGWQAKNGAGAKACGIVKFMRIV